MAFNRLGDIVKNASKVRAMKVAEQQAELRGEDFNKDEWEAEWLANNPPESEDVEDPETEGVEDPEPEGVEDPEPEGVEDPEPEGKQDPEVTEGDNEGDEDEELVTIVVNGEEKQVPKSKVYEQGIRTLQKEQAADERLQEANRRIREAELYEQSVRTKVEAQLRDSQEQNQGSPLSDKQDVELQTAAKKIVAQILDGEEDEAAEALAKHMGRGEPATPVNVDEIVSQTEARVQQRMEQQAAVKSFNDKYPQIAKDSFLWSRADAETNDVYAEHPDWTVEQVILEAGKRVQDWVDGLSGKSPNKEKDLKIEEGRERKREKKRTKDNLKVANARASTPKPKPPKTRSEVVQDMRKRRGLPPL